METPGLALYDKEERENLGASLQDAKRKAKEIYPIAPQLDICRPLVGQETVPDFSVMTSPTEKILSQISILEDGLRHGGHVNSLTGICDELARMVTNSNMSPQNGSPQRVFVSILSLF